MSMKRNPKIYEFEKLVKEFKQVEYTCVSNNYDFDQTYFSFTIELTGGQSRWMRLILKSNATYEDIYEAFQDEVDAAKNIKTEFPYNEENIKSVQSILNTINKKLLKLVIQEKKQLESDERELLEKLKKKYEAVDYLKLFSDLPNINMNRQITLNDSYNPTLYKWEGRWIVSWISDEGDSLIEILGDTPEEAIMNAVEYIKSEGYEN